MEGNSYNCFGHLCEVPIDVLNNLKNYYDILKDMDPDQNLGHYKQWFTQTSNAIFTDIDQSFTHWKDNDFLMPTKNFFNLYFTKIYRFRFSLLQSGSIVDYHTKHQLPRIHIPLNDSGSVFVVQDEKGREHFYNLTYGHAHFINVTMRHKVIGTTDVDRINSFFCFTSFKDKNIESKFLK